MATKAKYKPGAIKQESKPMWLIMRVHMWKDMEFFTTPAITFPIQLASPENGSIGFMEVFDDYDKVLAEAKDGDMIVPIITKETKR